MEIISCSYIEISIADGSIIFVFSLTKKIVSLLIFQAAKAAQTQSVQESRPEEKDYSGYHTVHNLEIPNLAITVRTLVFFTINSLDELFIVGVYGTVFTDRKYTGGYHQ